MEIAMAFDGLQIGGIERVGADYAKILKQLGHSVTIINLRPSLTEMEQEFPKECRIIHCAYPRILASEQYVQLTKKGTAFYLLYPLVKAVLWIVNFFYKIICRRAPEIKKKYDLSIAFSGHFNDLTFIERNYINAEKKICWLHGALYSYLLASQGYINLYRKIKNLIVLVDEAQEEAFFYNKGLKLSIHKLYNPTFIKNKNANQEIIDEIKKKYGKYMVMVSRFKYPHKDHYTVAKALEIVRNKYKDEINLIFIGNGPEENKVKEYVSQLQNVSESIFFLGSRLDVQNFYSAAYMLVHASVAGEGLPTVLLEALAYDLPIVVTDSKTGPREILGNEQYGLLCHVKDPEDMAKKIHMLVNDAELYEHYKNSSQERLQDFTPDRIKCNLQKILEEI